MDDRIRYVYKIFDKLNEDKFYIGTTFDIDKRWIEHKRDSNSKKLKADMLEFGTQDFDIEVIFEGTENEAYNKEIEFIANLKPYYNNLGDIGGKWGNGDNVGEHNTQSILEEKDIINICNRVVKKREQVCNVVKDYPQVCSTQIYNIVNGKAWKHVEEAPRHEANQNLQGENHGNAVLKDSDILDICIRVVENNEKICDVSKDYPQVDISGIITGKKWGHVKEAPRRKAAEDYKGGNNGNSTLEEKDIINICNRIVKNDEQVCDVAKDYPQISEGQICKITRGDAWKHVKEAPRRKIKGIKRFTKEEVLFIRNEAKEGKTPLEVRNEFYPNKPTQTIKNVIIGKSFSNYLGPIFGIDY